MGLVTLHVFFILSSISWVSFAIWVYIYFLLANVVYLGLSSKLRR